MSPKVLFTEFNEFINHRAVVDGTIKCVSVLEIVYSKVSVHADERLTRKICVMPGMPLTLLCRVMECI